MNVRAVRVRAGRESESPPAHSIGLALLGATVEAARRDDITAPWQ
jgi:hypothetical protein